jgi:vacuolar protein sorting-associated protein 13A/C
MFWAPQFSFYGFYPCLKIFPELLSRITDFTEEIHRLRPPRRFNRDGIIRPYIREEAEGYNLLLETDKGKYVETDEYITHVKVKEDGKTVFIVTDK